MFEIDPLSLFPNGLKQKALDALVDFVSSQAEKFVGDEAACLTLYSTKSYPFDAPETGKIAVKVINHYGDEVLKVYEV